MEVVVEDAFETGQAGLFSVPPIIRFELGKLLYKLQVGRINVIFVRLIPEKNEIGDGQPLLHKSAARLLDVTHLLDLFKKVVKIVKTFFCQDIID
ncbi:MAG TPA: hypothetical protein VGK71_04960 [Nitrospirota bacterium]